MNVREALCEQIFNLSCSSYDNMIAKVREITNEIIEGEQAKMKEKKSD